MGLFEGSHHYHENEQAAMMYERDDPPHQAKLSHELLGGAAAFYAMRKYEEHLANTGQQPSHALFKEFLAGAAGFEVDRLIETKGADAVDRHRAKKHAEEQAEQMYNAKFQQDQYQPPPQDWSYNTGGPRYQGYGGGGGGYGGPPQGGYGGGGYGGPPQGGGYGPPQGGGYGGGGYGGPPQGGGYPPQGGGYGQY